LSLFGELERVEKGGIERGITIFRDTKRTRRRRVRMIFYLMKVR
jgi:hypothetical protein